jgi:hypothetical protein
MIPVGDTVDQSVWYCTSDLLTGVRGTVQLVLYYHIIMIITV